MKRKILLQAFAVIAGSIMCALFLAGGTANAQGGGGIGSGGSGGGGAPGDGWPYSYYGWGWRIYPVSGSGPSRGFHTGNWASVQAACNGFSTSVAIFVINDSVGRQMGYDYHTTYYYRPPGTWNNPNPFSAYRTSPPYITVPAAKAAYDSLTVSKVGYTWGDNVSWFCYGLIPPNNVATLDGYKIEDTGAWATAPSAVSVSVSGSGSDGNNPFFFTNSAGGGNSIDMGSATSTTRTVSISGVPPGWQLLGHSICENGASCTSAWLASNIVSPGVTSFNHTFRSGAAYHMRWMFQRISATCTIDTFPGQMVVGGGNQFTVSMGVTHWGPPLVVGNPALTVQVRDPSGVITTSTPGYSVSALHDPATITSNPISFNSTLAGKYEMQWSLVGNGLNVLCPVGNNGNWINTIDGYAGYQPFFDVVGGDILSGDFIKAWNTDTGSYIGGGTQLAAIATGDIQNFVSGFGLPGGAATRSGSGLGFANTGATGTTYGGGYTVTPFVPEVPAQTHTLSGAVNLGSLATDGVYYANSSISLFGTLATGRQVTIYVSSGSVYISGSISYGAYGANIADIPRLTVLVEDGNISVARTVSEMRGIFYAGGSGVNGNFQSCASAINTPITFTTVNAYNLCNAPLTVYGAVSANKLVLGRTYGTYLANVNSVPVTYAERFYYSPELWLAEDGAGTASSGVNRYDSFVDLPPVL